MNIHYSVTDQDSFYSRSCSTLNRRKCKYRLRWMRYVWKNVIYNILCFTQRCPEHHRVKMRPAPDSAESSWVVSWTWVKLNKRTAPGYWVSEVTAFILYSKLWLFFYTYCKCTKSKNLTQRCPGQSNFPIFLSMWMMI